jgi:hypothetical protein
MGVQPDIPYDTLLDLIDQLSEDQKRDLLQRLKKMFASREQSYDEWTKLLRSAQVDAPVAEEPSPRREDWYDDDGR